MLDYYYDIIFNKNQIIFDQFYLMLVIILGDIGA